MVWFWREISFSKIHSDFAVFEREREREIEISMLPSFSIFRWKLANRTFIPNPKKKDFNLNKKEREKDIPPVNTNWFVCKWSLYCVCVPKYGQYFVQTTSHKLMFDFVASTTHLHSLPLAWCIAHKSSVHFSMEMVAGNDYDDDDEYTAKSEWIFNPMKNLMGICTERDLTLTCDILHLHTCKHTGHTDDRHSLYITQSGKNFCYKTQFLCTLKFCKIAENFYKDEWVQWMEFSRWNDKMHANPFRMDMNMARIFSLPLYTIHFICAVLLCGSQIVNKYWKIQRYHILWFMFSFWSVNIEDEILIWMEIPFDLYIFFFLFHKTHQCYHNIDALLSQILTETYHSTFSIDFIPVECLL